MALILLLLGFLLAASPVAAPPVQLVETRPVEATLGDPALPEARDVWLEMIRGAERTLDLEQFYLSTWPGEPLEPVLDAIGAAARRGVRVRLILDARMHDTYPRTADSLGKVPGIAVRLIDMAKVAGGGVQHAKYFLVDDKEMFIGSQNLDWRALKHIHEMGLRIRDARTVAVFQEVFEMDWAASDTISTRPAPAAEADSARTRPARAALDTARVAAGRRASKGAPRPRLPIRIVQAPGDTVDLTPGYAPLAYIPDSALWDRDAIVRLIDSARHEFIVTLLSYGRGREGDAVDEALRRAAARGVKVKILVSDWMAGRPAMADAESLVARGAEVRLSVVKEWTGGYIPYARVEHCKFAIADSTRLWLGTSNWEPSYFTRSRNLGVSMKNRNLAMTARRVFETSWTSPDAIVVQPGVKPAERVHGEEAPPGVKKYGG